MNPVTKISLFLFLWAVYAVVLLVAPFNSKGWLFHAAVSAGIAYASYVFVEFINVGKEG